MIKRNSFTIILPTYNRAESLQKTLQGLESIDYPTAKFEILIVDNNSNDQTKKVIKSFIQLHSRLNIAYHFEKKQGRTFASKKGISKALFKKIVFIDDDILVKPNFLTLYDELYKKYPKSAAIGGRILVDFPSKNSFISLLDKKQDYWIFGYVDHGKKLKELTYPESLFAGNLSLNLEQIKGEVFNPMLGRRVGNFYFFAEDFELTLRLELEDKTVIYAPELTMKNVVGDERLHLKYLLKRYYCAGAERYIIDERLSNISSIHQSFKLSSCFQINTLRELKYILTGKRDLKKQFIFILKNAAYFSGYILGPHYRQIALKTI